LLAPSPSTFQFSRRIYSYSPTDKTVSTYSITNAGLSIKLHIIQSWYSYFIVVNARVLGSKFFGQPCIPVRGFLNHRSSEHNNVFERLPFPRSPCIMTFDQAILYRDVFIRCRPLPLKTRDILRARFRTDSPIKYGFLLTFGCVKQLLDQRSLSLSHYDLGDGIYLIENTREMIAMQTYPKDLVDHNRNIFRCDRPITGSVYGGLLRLGSDKSHFSTGCVIFLAVKEGPGPGSELLWFAEGLSADAWGGPMDDDLREKTLLRLGQGLLAKEKWKRVYQSSITENLGTLIEIGDLLEQNGDEVLRTAHFQFTNTRSSSATVVSKRS